MEVVVMKKIKILYLPIVFSFLITAVGYAQQMKNVAQSTMTFLRIDPVARSAGMGEASTCMDNDVSALFHNPAGIARLKGGALSLNYNQWLADMKQYGIAAAFGHSTLGTFATSLVLMDNGEIDRTIPDASEKGFHLEDPFNVNQFAVGIGYGRQLTDKFSIGGQVKYVYQDLGPSDIIEIKANVTDTLMNKEYKEGTYALDFGTIYYTGFKDLRVAMSFRNFGASVKYAYDYYQLPLVLKVGIAMNVLSVISNKEGQSLEMLVETVLSNDYFERMNWGWEYSFKDLFYIRAGYRYNYDEGNFTAGFGFTPTVTNMNLKIDYAYVNFGDVFGAVHRVSFGFGL